MKKAFYAAVIVTAIVLGVISWFVLPENVAVQIGFDGKVSNTMPKLLAIIIPVLMSVIGGIIGIKSNDSNRNKGTLLLCVGIFVMLITFFFNFSR